MSGYNLYTHKFVNRRRLLAADYSASNVHTICCPSGYFYTAITDSGFVCTNPNHNTGCDKMIKNTSDKVVCDTCLEGFNKSLEHCCPPNEAWSTTKNACTKIYVEGLHNCLENKSDTLN